MSVTFLRSCHNLVFYCFFNVRASVQAFTSKNHCLRMTSGGFLIISNFWRLSEFWRVFRSMLGHSAFLFWTKSCLDTVEICWPCCDFCARWFSILVHISISFSEPSSCHICLRHVPYVFLRSCRIRLHCLHNCLHFLNKTNICASYACLIFSASRLRISSENFQLSACNLIE